MAAMVRMFVVAPWSVKAGLMRMQGRELALGLRMLMPSAHVPAERD